MNEDRLGELIMRSQEAPLPWAAQQQMVDLFTKQIEKTGIEHKKHVEKLEKIIHNLEENKKIKAQLGREGTC